ncbi:MFS transporter [Marinactinospora thermotolerans]|uniref:Predicted arabinose efflux permease, MFS family n=1 Tax=Marinactinospora thermotolerans DSM 45154 TaxID=1122192 RepID=A0A1T4SGH8_9ACTN|nr:MFS transporter [Marinactinospora thermotolerans]SKA27404.1 Predicted arabinose efflux permease, MFS family [Marinactinospora thermotolerans DSM 45154]
MTSEKDVAGNGRWLVWLLGSVVLTQTALNLARPLLSYRAISFGADELAIGLITAAYALVSVVSAVPLGRFTDRYPRSPLVIVAGTLLLAAAPVLMALSTSLWTLALGGTVLGLGHLVFMIAGQGLVARLSPEDGLDRNFGWFTAAVSVGQMAGPALAGALLGEASGAALREPTRMALLVAVVVALLALPGLLGVARGGGGRVPPTPERGPRLPLTGLLRSPGIPTGLFVSLALLAAVDILTAYLPLIAEQNGIAPTVAGALLSLRAAASIASRLLLPVLLRRWSRRALIVVSAAGAAVALAVVPLPLSGPAVMAVALGVGGFLLGLGQPLTMTTVVRAVPASARSTALALRLMSNRVGQVAMPAGASLVATATGVGGALWFTCAVLALAAGAAARTPGD